MEKKEVCFRLTDKGGYVKIEVHGEMSEIGSVIMMAMEDDERIEHLIHVSSQGHKLFKAFKPQIN